jgi:hypothetical protein
MVVFGEDIARGFSFLGNANLEIWEVIASNLVNLTISEDEFS